MNLNQAFQFAEKKKIAIGHFNVSNLETFEAVVKAGKKSRMPIIVGVSEGAIKHAGIDFFIWAKGYLSKKYRSDFFLHLDHGKDLDVIRQAIDYGFDSVMIDASGEKFYKNIYLTKLVVNWARKKNVWVEAEIGSVGGSDEDVRKKKIIFTDPEQAKDFQEKTKCNSLAISIGTSHGPNKFLKKSNLNIDILKKVNQLVRVPLVLHGASGIDKKTVLDLKKQGFRIGNPIGVSENDIYKAVKNGIRKVNVDTDLNLVAIDSFLNIAKQKGQDLKLYKILDKAMIDVEQTAMDKIKLFSKR